MRHCWALSCHQCVKGCVHVDHQPPLPVFKCCFILCLCTRKIYIFVYLCRTSWKCWIVFLSWVFFHSDCIFYAKTQAVFSSEKSAFYYKYMYTINKREWMAKSPSSGCTFDWHIFQQCVTAPPTDVNYEMFTQSWLICCTFAFQPNHSHPKHVHIHNKMNLKTSAVLFSLTVWDFCPNHRGCHGARGLDHRALTPQFKSICLSVNMEDDLYVEQLCSLSDDWQCEERRDSGARSVNKGYYFKRQK